MDERTIDEFESLFEAAVRPSVEIEPVDWTRIVIGLDGSDRADSATAIGLHLASPGRLAVPVHFLATLGIGPTEDEAAGQAALQGFLDAALARAAEANVTATGATSLGHPGKALVTEAQAQPTSLLIVPTPHGPQDVPDHKTLGTTVDHLLNLLGVPTLLIKEPVEAPEAVFSRLLVYVPGGFEIGSHFSIPFSMVDTSGQLELLHVVDEVVIRQVAQALEITPDVDTEKAQSIEKSIEARMSQLLAQAVQNVRDEAYSCHSVVELGNPVERVALNLMSRKSTLLVVDSETQEELPIEPESYAIIKEVSGLPILVL